MVWGKGSYLPLFGGVAAKLDEEASV
jgi:hypothetical protein